MEHFDKEQSVTFSTKINNQSNKYNIDNITKKKNSYKGPTTSVQKSKNS